MRRWAALFLVLLPAPALAQHEGHAGHEPAAVAEPAAAPSPPTDHAADRHFDPAEMERARAALRRENGGFTGAMIVLDRMELVPASGRGGYAWEADAWFGGDIDRLVVRSRGEGEFDGGARAEAQALYSRAITPFWNLHLGARHDFGRGPSRTYAVAGVEGLAPYWLHVTAQAYLSDRGDLHARIEATYDERLTQRLILQPSAEIALAAQDVPSLGIGAGLSEIEVGLRLRYEIRREFAPYVGAEWSKRTGNTARLARIAGEDPDRIQLVIGLRVWF